jgi:hypothetical protein
MRMKQLFNVLVNGRTPILVKAEAEELEQLVKENKIIEYTLAKVYILKSIEQ